MEEAEGKNLSSIRYTQNDIISRDGNVKTDRESIQRALIQYPDRQPNAFGGDSSDSEDRLENVVSIADQNGRCAAGVSCRMAESSDPPAHNCGVCEAPIHNLCDYEKRVMNDYGREVVFLYTESCYAREKTAS